MSTIEDKRKLNRLLLAIFNVLICLICLLTSSKSVGYFLTYIFKFLLGNNFVLFFIISAVFLLIKIFAKNTKYKFYKIYILLLVSVVGYGILCSFGLLNLENPFDNLSNAYVEVFNYIKNNDISNYVFAVNTVNSGYISLLLCALFTKLFGQIGTIIVGSIIMASGLILSILDIFNYYKKTRPVKEIKKEEVVIKEEPKVEIKEEIKKDDPLDNLFGNACLFNNSFVETESSSIVEHKPVEPTIIETNKQPSFNNVLEEEPRVVNNQSTPKPKGTFNIFTDEVYSEKELYVDKVNKTHATKFNIFTDKLFNDDVKEEIIQSPSDNIVCVQDSKSSVDAINNSSRNDNSINLDEFENSTNNDVKVRQVMQEESKFTIKVDPVEEEKESYINEVPQAYTDFKRNFDTNDEDKQVYDYPLPSISLFKDSPYNDNMENIRQAELSCIKLNSKLRSLGINARVHNFKVAPSFTRFEIEVEESVKVGSITNVKNDLMMALSAEKINILAPIPGTNFAGVDIPNVNRSIVSFKECFINIPKDEFNNKLLLILGKDIVGNVITLPLNKAPHLLVAGTSGSGKSVCLNTLVCSIITRAYPSEVSLILIDPKIVEFSSYASIPHLRCPVIVDVKKAIVALKKLEEEMINRNKTFVDNNVKNIQGYNQKMKEMGKPIMDYIVCVIDEFQYLIYEAKQEVEAHIQKLCSMGRSTGIHIIVATQRPSVDIITGVIKGNINCRIAFAVPSNADSRTILDETGAEELLGQGDMLLKSSQSLKLARVQNLFIQDDEIDNITNYLKQVARPNYDPNFMDLEEHDPEQMRLDELIDNDKNSDDSLYEKIIEFAKSSPFVSTSLFVRRFALGTARAGRMIDKLEEDGFIGPRDGNKPRESYLYKLPNNKGENNEEEQI